MSTQIVFFLLIFVNTLIFFNFSRIAKFLNIYDNPDKKRKFHKNPVAPLGGLIILLSLLIIFFFDYYFYYSFFFELGFNKKEILIFIFFCLIIFLIYLFDDIKNISPNYKLLTLIFLIILYILIDTGSLLKLLNFSFLQTAFQLHQFSIPFTILCFLLFINALNMFDGINLQCGSYSLFIFIILFFYTENYLFLLFIIPIIFFLRLNYLNICFLGNSGTALLSFTMSVLIIKAHNLGIIYADDIFLLMCIPGYDLLRLTFTRIISKKHPFFPDTNHLHHIISKKLNSFFAFSIIFFFIIIINLINIFKFFSTLFIIFFSLILYSFIVFYFKKIKL